ncbi:MAG: diguanylate cyclase [Pseudomonadota bacterium]
MAGDIIIVDGVATNRIVLKVKLLAAQYRVRPCTSFQDAATEVAAALPDLIIMDMCSNRKEAAAFCQHLKADDRTALIPVIATGSFATPLERVTVLEAGADDILTKPIDDQILQARIRCLLRTRDAKHELRMRDGTRTALGFAEDASSFAKPASVVIASTLPRPKTGALSSGLRNAQVTAAPIEGLVAGQSVVSHKDLYVLDFRTGLADTHALYRLLSDLRSRPATRHAGILVLLPPVAQHAAAMALDLGANDVICADVLNTEIQHRAEVLLSAKRQADALRKTVETGLEAAITDPLTGLFNRRYAEPHLARLSEESRKSGKQFALMVLDLDHFKAVNDTYGHAAGDEVLRQVADRLKDNLRAVDLLARIGGEEFLVAIPNSDVVHARTAAERLCTLIRDTPFFVGRDKTEVRITLSVGVTLSDGSPPSDMEPDLDGLVDAADVALYAAKSGGRDKVSLSAA